MWKKVSTIIISTLIAAGILFYMLYRVWDDLIVALQDAIWYYLIFASLVCLAAWLFRGYRYRSILSSLQIQVGVKFSTACIFVSQTANMIVPARLGDLVRIFILGHEYGSPVSKGISSIVVERVFDIVTVALLGTVALVFVLNVPDWFYSLIIIPLVAGAIFFGILFFARNFSSKNKIIQYLLTLLEQIKQASLSLRAVVLLSTSSIVIWLMDIVVCFFIALMFQDQIPFAVVVLAIVVGNLVKAIPLTPGGVGTYELAVAFTFTLAGVPMAEATIIAVIDHLVKNIITVMGGIVSIYYFGGWVLGSIKSALEKRFGGMQSGRV